MAGVKNLRKRAERVQDEECQKGWGVVHRRVRVNFSYGLISLKPFVTDSRIQCTSKVVFFSVDTDVRFAASLYLRFVIK